MKSKCKKITRFSALAVSLFLYVPGVLAGPPSDPFESGTHAHFDNGIVAKVAGDATVTLMDGTAQILEMHDNARVDTMKGGMIQDMFGNSSIGLMDFTSTPSDGLEDMYDNATVETLQNGQISGMLGSSRVINFNGGLIGEAYRNSHIKNMNNGVLEIFYDTASIGDMNGGTISHMFGNARIVRMNGGKIDRLESGIVQFTTDAAKVQHLTGQTDLGFFVRSPTDHGKLVFDAGATTTGYHTIHVLNFAHESTKHADTFTLDFIDQTAATNTGTLYTLPLSSYQLGAYDYNALGELVDDIYSVHFDRIAMNTNSRTAIFSATGGSIATAAQHVATSTNTLQKRLGDLRLARLYDREDGTGKNGLWVRQYARHSNLDAFEHTSTNTYGVELGYDRKLDLNTPANVYLGIAGGTGWSKGDANSAETELSAPSIGFYGAYIHDNGFFMDVTARHYWLDLDVDVKPQTGNKSSYNKNTEATALSFELGKQWSWDVSDQAKFFVEPRAQYNYTYVEGYSVNIDGTDAEVNDYNSSLLTGGVNAGFRVAAGTSFYEPYAKLNIKHEFDGKVKARADAERESVDFSGARVEAGLGLNAQFTENFSMYADGSYEKGSKIESTGGNLGFRLAF